MVGKLKCEVESAISQALSKFLKENRWARKLRQCLRRWQVTQ